MTIKIKTSGPVDLARFYSLIDEWANTNNVDFTNCEDLYISVNQLGTCAIIRAGGQKYKFIYVKEAV